MEKKRGILDKYREIIGRVHVVTDALRDVESNIRRQTNPYTVHNQSRRLISAHKNLQNYIEQLAATPGAERARAILLVHVFDLGPKICEFLKLIGRCARKAVLLTQTILKYDNIFESASNAPLDMKFQWNSLMNYVFNMQKGMVTLIVSAHIPNEDDYL